MAKCTPVDGTLDQYSSAWNDFAATIDAILAQLLPMSPATIWPIIGQSGLHIGDVGAADFAFKLANISWTLVDGNRYTTENGGVGEVLSVYRGGNWQNPADWQSAAEQINASDFEKYVELEGGAHYLILHETAHTTQLGLQTNNQQFDQYLHAGGDRSDGAAWAASDQWLYNEQVANAIARTVGGQLGLNVLDRPTCGYPGDARSATMA